MDSRTEIKISPSAVKISLQSQMVTIGSCFADIMGGRLLANKFSVLVNPFGVMYNPVSVNKILQATLRGSNLSQDLLWQQNGQWFHYDLHSDFFDESASQLLKRSNILLAQTGNFIKKADVLLLTLGTAFVYQLKANQAIVSNCHKAPANLFTKHLLSIAEVTKAIIDIYTSLVNLRPHLQVILTLSPVRHLKDGMTENQVSKSILRVACHQASVECPQISYFPAYEIMLDDLRDYRFYKKDMIHPSEIAEDYIWEKFVQTYADKEAIEFMKEWEKITKALAHKPFHVTSAAHQTFLQQTREKLLKLSKLVNVRDELQQIEKEIRI